MSLFMQKLGALTRVFDVGATSKPKVCKHGNAVCAHAPNALHAQHAVASRKWVITGLR